MGQLHDLGKLLLLQVMVLHILPQQLLGPVAVDSIHGRGVRKPVEAAQSAVGRNHPWQVRRDTERTWPFVVAAAVVVAIAAAAPNVPPLNDRKL